MEKPGNAARAGSLAAFFPQSCIIVWLLLLLWGCASRQNLIVLMPDESGKVGEITLKNESGSQTLNQAGLGVTVTGADAAPSDPEPVPEETIKELFQDAVTARPPAPETFLLFFASGTTSLTPESRDRIPEIMTAIRKRDIIDISIIGHSDRTGNEPDNWALSLKRARVVRQILADEGVPLDNIESTSHGEENPLIPTADNVAEPRNRRVEVTLR